MPISHTVKERLNRVRSPTHQAEWKQIRTGHRLSADLVPGQALLASQLCLQAQLALSERLFLQPTTPRKVDVLSPPGTVRLAQ